MKILVTGGAGFIGVNLCKRLMSEGIRVTCLDNFYSSSEKNLDFLRKESGGSFEFVEHDLINPLPESILSGEFDRIYHLACPASPPHYQKDHIYTLKVNFIGTLNILELARKHGSKILYTSTSEVYGNPEVSPQNEKYRGNVNPHGIRSCYDEGKRVGESLCMNYFRQYDLPVRIVRIFNTYGPYMDREDGRAVSNFIVQALQGENITIYGDGTQTRSFQYIDDLLEGIIGFMNSEDNFPGPVNFGNSHEITIKELADTVISLSESKSRLEFSDLPKDDPLQRRPDISLAKDKFGWEPKIGLEDGLKKTIEYFRQVV
ncbi:MAG: UDP-glucuronic acid decarboxylase family protein [Nitrospirota bacterium]